MSPENWKGVNGWKFTSLVWASLDTGLRPIKVDRAAVNWVDVRNGVLRIPKEESSQGEQNWIVSLTDRTAQALDRWITEREQYDLYEDTDELWLPREGNPYESKSFVGS